MDSKHRKNPFHLSYQGRLVGGLLLAIWALVACFGIYQYNRESQHKAENLNAKLQLLNSALLEIFQNAGDVDTVAITNIVRAMPHFSANELKQLRLTLIDSTGRAFYDNAISKHITDNHFTRPEVVQALKNGSGYTVERVSETNNVEYFYSATLSPRSQGAREGALVIRTALPYTVDLRELLGVDQSFIWAILLLAVGVSCVCVVVAKRIGGTVTRLKQFSEKAERGERIYDSEPFPDGELGSISSNIVSLYARLQQTSDDRDNEHQRALEQQRENDRLKRELTNNINHELKTPVASMRLCLETLQAHPDLPDGKRQEFMKRCMAECERLGSMLADVSTLTRLSDGLQQIAKEPVDICAVVTEAIEEAKALEGADRFTFDNQLPQGLTINANAGLIMSVFRNLLTNAVMYSGGTRIDIRLSLKTKDKVFITFADDGNGVAEQHLVHLFERFYRVDTGRSRKLGGTGLGLSIVKNAISVHGGAIRVTNADPHGLRFTFSLGI